MFYIYNETSKQLELNVKTDKFFHLGIKDMKFGVDIMTSSTEGIDKEYNTTIFESLESVQILSCHSYNLIYNNKSGNPFLRIDEEPSDNSYDAYLLVYKYNEEENGMKLFNEKRINFNVLYSKHDEENQIIYIIGVAKPTLNPKFFLTFSNGSTYNTKHLMFNRKFISLVYNKYYTEEEAKANKFANVIMTPSKYQMLIPDKSRKPFSIIVAPWNNPEKKPYLENILKSLPYDAVKLIVVDGVFSMEGDLANLPAIVELKHKYNCSVMVDEAHGIGVFGRDGRGVCDYFGLTDEVDLIMGTFSKSLASIGGFIAGDFDTINYLRHTCRTYIFSASDTPAATAAAMEALHIIQKEPERIEKLWAVTKYALRRFREEGFEIGDTESPIIPLYVRDATKTFVVTKLAYDNGVFINSVIPPACAPQDTLVRFALMATHTEEQVERGVQILKKIFVEQGIIK